ncbi:MAG TPA: GTPase Era, partial [Thermodesulfovibrionales bacterium]|nr:GTPase Era [Thermodesulfovibrionales bacterium]
GRPNVGKSTLLNSILGEKVAIVTSRAQTTRKKIIGIRTSRDSQIIFIDTPGIHRPSNRLGEFMLREAKEALKDADVIFLMVEPQAAGPGDRFIINSLRESGTAPPVFLIINKIDLIKKTEILPLIEEFSGLYPFETVFPLSALNPDDVKMLVDTVVGKLPQGPKYYPDDAITDEYERFLVSEIIREKVMELTKDEVPHAVAVEIVQWTEREDGLTSLSANIYVERQGQKGIIIGKGGGRLKSIGTAARADIERFLGRKVFMELWVKVKEDWRSDLRKLKEMGFE